MTKELKTLGSYSLKRWAGNILFISGQIGMNSETEKLEEGFKRQCEKSLANIEFILKSEGLILDDLVKLTVLMSDLEDFEQVNEIFKEYLKEPYPSRSTFEVAALPKDALIEIEAIAVRSTTS